MAEAAADAAVTPSVIAVGLTDETIGTEALHLLLDTRLGPEDARPVIAQAIRDALHEAFGLTGIGTHWIAAGLIPRTPSGKIQRFRCREIVAARLADRQQSTPARTPPRRLPPRTGGSPDERAQRPHLQGRAADSCRCRRHPA
ncbi:hypothetical protein ACFQ4K_08925 [Tistrella bauzanensis]